MKNRIHVGNAPCSWGTLEFEGMGSEVVPYGQMLDELAETGYTGTELGDWAYMPVEPAQLNDELVRRDLTMLGAYVPVALRRNEAHASGEQHALKVARLLASVASPGHSPLLVLADENGEDPVRTRHAGRILPDMGLSDAEWRTFCDGAERIARSIRDETGLATVFHHHCAGFVETPEEIERFLAGTDSGLVGLVFDTGHYAFGAGGCHHVSAGLERFSDRIRYVHFKDVEPTVAARTRRLEWDYFTALKHGLFCELGRGCVDFSVVVRVLRERSYEGWIVVEQDVLPGMGSPKESARRNREYLARLGL